MEYAIVGALLVGLGGLAYVAQRYNGVVRRTRRVLRRARVVPIAKLVDGRLACIRGRVEVEGEQVSSLITQQPCVAFDTVTTFFEGELAVMRTTRLAVPFYVVDDTGRARVDAPQVALCNRPAARSGRYEERMIRVGDRVRIVGSVSLDPARQASADHGFREGGFSATITGTALYPLLADVEDE